MVYYVPNGLAGASLFRLRARPLSPALAAIANTVAADPVHFLGDFRSLTALPMHQWIVPLGYQKKICQGEGLNCGSKITES